MALLTVDLDYKEWLFGVRYLKVVGLDEVLGDTHPFTIISGKALCDWGLVEVDTLDKVGLLVS